LGVIKGSKTKKARAVRITNTTIPTFEDYLTPRTVVPGQDLGTMSAFEAANWISR